MAFRAFVSVSWYDVSAALRMIEKLHQPTNKRLPSLGSERQYSLSLNPARKPGALSRSDYMHLRA